MRLVGQTLAAVLLVMITCAAAERKAVFPPGVKPVGPYSPGVLSGSWLYVSGQGARDAEGKLGADTIEQTRQALDNVRAVVETAGMRLENILYVQVYLSNIAAYDDVDGVFRDFFPRAPARTIIGVKRMPTDTPVEISAIVYNGPRDNVRMGGVHPAAVKAGGRTYLSGILGRRSDTARLPDSGAKQAELAFESLDAVMKNAQIKLTDLSMVTVYFSTNMRREDAESVAAKRLKGVPYMLVETMAIPLQANIEIMAVSAPDLAFTPLQDLATVDKSAFANAVAANVYIDTIEHFADMNKVYSAQLNEVAPARTTVQTTEFSEGKKNWVALVSVK
jgi:2-iminobutanoate/2-iminopropanoate deaminase